jgi:hypothetical protein
MKLVMNRVMAALAILAPLVFATPMPAYAGDGVYVVVGTGTLAPGLPCPNEGCEIDLDFTMAGGGTGGAGLGDCTMHGQTGQDTLLQGSATGTVSCSGGLTATASVALDRTGALVTMSGEWTINGNPCGCIMLGWWECADPDLCTEWYFVGLIICF